MKNKAFFPQAAAFRVGDKDGRGGLSKLEAQATIQDHFQQHGVKKRSFLRHLYIKTIISPRQARDKHRENSKKRPFVLRQREGRADPRVHRQPL
jgi:hypothetical protein